MFEVKVTVVPVIMWTLGAQTAKLGERHQQITGTTSNNIKKTFCTFSLVSSIEIHHNIKHTFWIRSTLNIHIFPNEMEKLCKCFQDTLKNGVSTLLLLLSLWKLITIVSPSIHFVFLLIWNLLGFGWTKTAILFNFALDFLFPSAFIMQCCFRSEQEIATCARNCIHTAILVQLY